MAPAQMGQFFYFYTQLYQANLLTDIAESTRGEFRGGSGPDPPLTPGGQVSHFEEMV